MSDRPKESGGESETARPRRRVALVSLGCPKNQVDSELMLGRLRAEGHELVDDPDEADTLVVNTCSFIDRARAESVDALLDAAEWKKGAEGRQVVAAGCLVQRSGEELSRELPEIDTMVGLDDIHDVSVRIESTAPPSAARLPSLGSASAKREPAGTASAGAATGLFSSQDPRVRLSPPWTAYVKIAEGCDQSCAFCAIPSFRGRMRSRSLDDLSAELARLAEAGVVEANLVAQDSTGYGRDIGMRDGLAELVRHLDGLEVAPDWIRIHYLYPGRISRAFLEAVSEARRIAPYIDLPLQHAHPDVLRRMRRPGSAASYLRQLESLRRAMPDAGLRSGFIVGFPGEDDDAFATLCEFVEEAGFDAAGVFTYSHEESTGAFDLEDDVPAELKEERREILEDIVASVAHERNRARIGTILEVLLEGEAEEREGYLQGRWAGQAPEVDGRVLVAGARALRAGDKLRVRIEDAEPFELLGRPAESDAP